MRVAFIYPPRLVGGRPVDFHNVRTAPRGLTGSEANLLFSAQGLAALGHDVTLYIEQPNAGEWEGVWLHDLDGTMVSRCALAGVDAAIVGVDVDYLRLFNESLLRVVLQQCNDFSFAKPDFRDFVDVYVLPSHAHVRSQTDPSVRPELAQLGGYLPPEKCEVQPNGVWLEDYDKLDVERVEARCVHISSADRGAHLMLQEWPAIKRAVPNAELRVFYYSLEQYRAMYRGQDISGWPRGFAKEFAARSQYIDRALLELAPFGVQAIGPVSKDRLARELKEAHLLLYPCEPVQWTESFGCAVLEGCASGALPVISDVDAFGELFGGYCPMVKSPASLHIAEWRDMVITRLRNPELAEMERRKARELAEHLTWQNAAKILEGILERRLKDR